jgi:cytochrome P450
MRSLVGWIERMSAELLDGIVDSTPEERTEAQHHLREHVRRLIAERRERRTDDLLCLLVDARDNEDRLSEDELVNLTMTLFLGGFETTAAQLGSTVWTLMPHRHLWHELLDDPELNPRCEDPQPP